MIKTKMIEPNHPVVTGLFCVLVMPLLVLGFTIALVVCLIQVGIKAFDSFIEWL